MILPLGLWGHFALGTLSNTSLKDAVFEIHVFRKKSQQVRNIRNVKCETKTKKDFALLAPCGAAVRDRDELRAMLQAVRGGVCGLTVFV